MVSALILAGGTGSRMNSKSMPKQFLELHGKPIIIHTLEFFEKNKSIDNIVVVCLAGWIDYLKEQVKKFNLNKPIFYVEGGKDGQSSRYNGLKFLYSQSTTPNSDIVLIHDGVRPLITDELITTCIESVKNNGSAITVSPARETITVVNDDNTIELATNRTYTKIARSPQGFFLEDIVKTHETAIKDGINNSTDAAALMLQYNKVLHTIEGPVENIKITTPSDYYIFRALYEARENSQILGY